MKNQAQTQKGENATINFKKMKVAELIKMANVEEDTKLTKAQLIKLIKENQAKADSPKTEDDTPKTDTPSADTPKTEDEAPKAEKSKPKNEIINIWDSEVGDVVRYKSSQKPYIVAEKVEEGDKPYLYLVSPTQKYKSMKKEFEVVRLHKGEGQLPDAYNKEALKNVNKKFDEDALNQCLFTAKADLLKMEEAKAKKDEKAETEEVEADTPKTEDEAPKAEEKA